MPRWMDGVLAAAGLLLCAPLFAACALAIRVDSRGAVFFRQERVGRGGKIFRIFKFRTMVTNAPELGGSLTLGSHDPRVTRVGRVLRRAKLDELPQLINVLRGEMKFVGPRPEVPEYVRLYDEIQRAVLLVPPGITDPASIRFRDEENLLAGAADPQRFYREQILPEKLALNADYLAGRTLWKDLEVIAETVRKAVIKV